MVHFSSTDAECRYNKLYYLPINSGASSSSIILFLKQVNHFHLFGMKSADIIYAAIPIKGGEAEHLRRLKSYQWWVLRSCWSLQNAENWCAVVEFSFIGWWTNQHFCEDVFSLLLLLQKKPFKFNTKEKKETTEYLLFTMQIAIIIFKWIQL